MQHNNGTLKHKHTSVGTFRAPQTSTRGSDHGKSSNELAYSWKFAKSNHSTPTATISAPSTRNTARSTGYENNIRLNVRPPLRASASVRHLTKIQTTNARHLTKIRTTNLGSR